MAVYKTPPAAAAMNTVDPHYWRILGLAAVAAVFLVRAVLVSIDGGGYNVGAIDGGDVGYGDYGIPDNMTIMDVLDDVLEKAPDRLREKVMTYFAERDAGEGIGNGGAGCHPLSSWRRCLAQVFETHRNFVDRNCPGNGSSAKCAAPKERSTASGHIFELGRCPPIFLLDSGRECGGDEYEAYLADDDEDSGGDVVALDTVDMENGVYMFQIPTFSSELVELNMEKPKLVVILVYTGCDGLRHPPSVLSSKMVGTSISVGLINEDGGLYCSSIDRPSEDDEVDLGDTERRKVHFFGDNAALGLMVAVPHDFSNMGFARLGMPLSEAAAKRVAAKVSKGDVIIFSNAMADVRASEHEDGFEAHAQMLYSVLEVFKAATGGGRNVVVLTGLRMLPHRMCRPNQRKTRAEECSERTRFVSDARMRLLNGVYRAVAAGSGVRLVDTYAVLFGHMPLSFNWGSNWMLSRGAVQIVWPHIAREVVQFDYDS